MLFFSSEILGVWTILAVRELLVNSRKRKSRELALIAVCNKLLKQAFAIAKSGLIFDNEYKSKLAKI